MKALVLKIRWLLLVAALFLSAALNAEASTKGVDLIQQVRHNIKTQLTHQSAIKNLVCQGELICGLKLMPIFYRQRQFAPVWFDENGLLPAARTLIQTINNVHKDGLHPTDYHTSVINLLLEDYDFWPLNPTKDDLQAAIRADLDLILTDAFLLLGTHLNGGRIDPETLHTDWIVPEEAIDMLEVLHTVTAQTDLVPIIEQLRPGHDGYIKLRHALNKMRKLQAQGGWPAVAQGATLKPGARNSRIPTLRRRLVISGDLSTDQPQGKADHYDERLTAAVQTYQQRHGLKADGIIGGQTLEALNVTTDQRVRQIELNLERWRWLPHDLSQEYILVNTADFNLQVVANQQVALQMRVVVGRPARRTPVFSAPISYLVVNPYWNVPHLIAVEDILPKLVKGENYLTKMKFRVFKGWGENSKTINPGTVNWKIYSDTYFPFQLRQDPGPQNALGRIKFMMPNKFDVYLHDTPQRSHFNLVKRDFSSGCIRVENARALAEHLLSREPDRPPDHLGSAFENRERKIIRLSKPIPVHLLYMTAWLDETGTLQFRNDIYDRDRDLHRALVDRQPAPLPPLAPSEISATSY